MGTLLAVKAHVAALRKAKPLSTLDEARAALAVDLAGQLEAAEDGGKAASVAKALRETLDQLPTIGGDDDDWTAGGAAPVRHAAPARAGKPRPRGGGDRRTDGAAADAVAAPRRRRGQRGGFGDG